MRGEGDYYALGQHVIGLIQNGVLTETVLGTEWCRVKELADAAVLVSDVNGEKARANKSAMERARVQYASDDLEIDDNCEVSEAEGGTWVQAWVWLYDEEDCNEATARIHRSWKCEDNEMMGDLVMSAVQAEERHEGCCEEVVVHLANGWSLRSGLYEGSNSGLTSGEYVRLCDSSGQEIGYWDAAEWEDDPALVMGAILNSAAGVFVKITAH